jgi:tryptophanyl-tRNA synthetase
LRPAPLLHTFRPMTNTRRQRSLTAIKPTGLVHWGHFFGMIEPAIALSETMDAYYFLADYHALTTVRDAEALRRDTMEAVAVWVACGLDPEAAVVWRQSDVPEVFELSWILSCVTGYGLVERAHSFKDARARGKEINFGVVSYPVLMAADILLYDSDVVPVGQDQLQHVEMSRDMAGYFNQQFLGSTCHRDDGTWTGKGLKRPESRVREATGLVTGIDGRKMSSSYDNGIPIFGSKKAIKKRVMSIVTDSVPLEDPKDPDTCQVFQMYKLFSSEEEQAELAARYRGGNFGYGHAKLELLEKSQAFFLPMKERYEALIARPDEIEPILQRGAERARAVARPVLDRVRSAVGLPTH